MKWGGEPLRINGYYCPQTVRYMLDELESLAIAEPQLGLIVPETVASGRLYDLYREYTHEMWVDRSNSVLTTKRWRGVLAVNRSSTGSDLTTDTGSVPGFQQTFDLLSSTHGMSNTTSVESTGRIRDGTPAGNVCFLVRTYDMSATKSKSLFIHYGLPDLIQCKSAVC